MNRFTLAQKLAYSTLTFLLLSAFQVHSEEKKLNIQFFAQKDGCWCGIATIEMIEQYYRGSSWKHYAERQANLVKNANQKPGIAIGNKSLFQSKEVPCGPDGGLSTNEFGNYLNIRLDEHNKRYSQKDEPAANHQSINFHKRAIQSIKKNDPLIFSGHTRFADGSKKLFQHWYVIMGYKDTDGDPNTISENDGYYIYDSTVNAGLSNIKSLGSVGKFVSHENTMKHLAVANGRTSFFYQSR